MRSRNSFREKRRVALDSGDQKLYKKIIFKILLKNIVSMKIKQSGNLNSKKSRIFPGGKLSYSFFPGKNLLKNAIKHHLSVCFGLPTAFCYISSNNTLILKITININ